MKLITPEFEALFKNYPLGSQGNKKDPQVITRMFHPSGKIEWFLMEYDPKVKLGFGITKTQIEEKAGFISIGDMDAERKPAHLKIRWDATFKPNRLSVLSKEIFQSKNIDPDYRRFLKDRHAELQILMATGTITIPKELQSKLIALCRKALTKNSYAFLSDYLSFSWFGNSSFRQLKQLDDGLADFILNSLSDALALDVFRFLVNGSEGFRFLMEGGKSVTTFFSLLPEIGRVRLHEHWKKEANQFKEKESIKSVEMDNRYLTIYKDSNNEQKLVFEHLDPSLVWIGQPLKLT